MATKKQPVAAELAPSAVIQNLVLRNNKEQNELWDLRMEKHDKVFNDRMDKHEETVDRRFEKSEAKVDARFHVTESKIDETLKQVVEIGELVRESIRTQQGWHEDDLMFRKSVDERFDSQDTHIKATNDIVLAIEPKVTQALEDVKQVRHRLKVISWLISIGQGVRLTIQGGNIAMEKGKKFWVAAAALFSAISAGWLAFHSMWPAFKLFAHSHHWFNY